MANPYHDAEGKFCSPEDMLASIDSVQKKALSAAQDGNIEQCLILQKQAHELLKEYTLASKEEQGGLRELTNLKKSLQPKENKEEYKRKQSILVPKTHNYDEPTSEIINPESIYSAKVGSKANYVGEDGKIRELSLEEKIKGMREDFKEAKRKGYLPKGIKLTISKQRYANGASIKTVIHGLKNSEIFTTRNHNELTPNSSLISSRVSKIMDAYNYESIHPEIDYFNVDFFSEVEFETEEAASYKQKKADYQKIRRTTLTNRRKFLQEHSLMDAIKLSEPTGVQTRSGQDISLIPDHKGYVVLSQTINGTNRKIYETYDFSSALHDKTDEELIQLLNIHRIGKSMNKERLFPPQTV